MKTLINVARTKQWKLRVTLKGCCIVRARDDKQGSSSPVRYKCSEQHSAWRAHEATQPMRVCVCAMRWARATMQCTSDEQDACGQRCCRATARLARPASKQNARAGSDPSLGARWPAQQHATQHKAARSVASCGVWLCMLCATINRAGRAAS